MKRSIALVSLTAAALALTLGLFVSTSRAGGEKAAKVGHTAPQFSLQDQTGKTVNLSDYAGKIVVLEWFNEDCPIVQRHYKANTMNDLYAKWSPKDVAWLAINSTKDKSNDTNKQAAENWKMDRPILNDSTGMVGHLYGATNTPHMFVIDKDQRIAYMGAIDNDSNGNKKDKINYVDKALTELTSGNSVSQAETKAYGCGVHYAN